MRKLLPNQRITRKPDIFDCTPYDLLKCAQVLHSFLAERLEFASDPFNLTSASPKVNRDQKVGKDVAEWLLEMNCCWFVNRVVAVKRRYGLSLDSREAAAAQSRTESPIRLWCSFAALRVAFADRSVLFITKFKLETSWQEMPWRIC